MHFQGNNRAVKKRILYIFKFVDQLEFQKKSKWKKMSDMFVKKDVFSFHYQFSVDDLNGVVIRYADC
jgi:hypothetical protein